MTPGISVVVPTRNRPQALASTLADLKAQELEPDAYEIAVVDDGSEPKASVPDGVRLLRLEGRERSAARNAGARAAGAPLLLFVDDDAGLRPDFVARHLRAQAEWPGALAVGATRLTATPTPFGRFRQRLEADQVPVARGPTSRRNFCTAQNMSIARATFEALGGFDEAIACGEDQDLALRHTARGGQIVYVPEALGVHFDTALDIRSYCRRSEWGAREMLPFCRKHPDWPDNRARQVVNAPPAWGREPIRRSLRKTLKTFAATAPAIAAVFWAAAVLERAAPESRLLDLLYRAALGAHLTRGYREGLRRYGAPGPA